MSTLDKRKAVVLVSGGLDSATVLAIAKQEGYECFALSFDYGQRHKTELMAAKRIVAHLGGAVHRIMPIPLHEIGGSALTDETLAVPSHTDHTDIPITYVPARNLIFLSLATAWAEVLEARDIFIGASSIDYSGYPDCRPAFFQAFEQLIRVATKAGDEGQKFCIHAPLLYLSKAETIKKGISLGVDYQDTVSCYQATVEGLACGICDSCSLRKKGFIEAGVPDPTRYHMTKSVN